MVSAQMIHWLAYNCTTIVSGDLSALYAAVGKKKKNKYCHCWSWTVTSRAVSLKISL